LATPVKSFALAFVLSISALSHAQKTVSTAVTANGETRLVLGAATVTVRTRETPTPKQDEMHDNRWSACTGARVPCLLTEFFQIRVNGKPIYVPYSAFADLGDMGSLTLQRLEGKYVLTIGGGDAAGSYLAKLTFDSTRVIARVVAPGEDRTQPSERTTYYNPKRFD
jgi:hypothetical protein